MSTSTWSLDSLCRWAGDRCHGSNGSSGTPAPQPPGILQGIVRFAGDGPSGSWSNGFVGRVTGTAILSLVVGMLGACAGGSRGIGGNAASTPTPTVTASVIDWTALPRSLVLIDGPWMGMRCSLDPSQLCVRRNGAAAGAVELLTHPDAHPAGTEPIAYLTQFVAAFQKGVATNPQATCANSNTFSAQPVREVAINGGVGLRSDWSITNPAGQVVERQITYFALGRATIASLGATALVPGATCVQALGSEFTPAVMADAVAVLDRIAAESRFGSG